MYQMHIKWFYKGLTTFLCFFIGYLMCSHACIHVEQIILLWKHTVPVEVMFEKEVYTVSEDAGYLEVCAVTNRPISSEEYPIQLSLTGDGSYIGTYVAIYTVVVLYNICRDANFKTIWLFKMLSGNS